MRIAVGSMRGAPGVTTLALALSLDLAARSRQVLLMEADPAGGVLAARLGIPVSPGLVDFTAAAHHRPIVDVAAGHVQSLTSALCVLPGPPAARQATAALDVLVPDLAPLLDDPDGDVVVDGGRLLPNSPSMGLAASADSVVCVAWPVVSELATLVPRLRELLDDGLHCIVATVDAPPRSSEPRVPTADVADVLHGVEVIRLPHDPAAVRLLDGDPTGRRWPRTRLAMAVGQLAEHLLTIDDAPASLAIAPVGEVGIVSVVSG